MSDGKHASRPAWRPGALDLCTQAAPLRLPATLGPQAPTHKEPLLSTASSFTSICGSLSSATSTPSSSPDRTPAPPPPRVASKHKLPSEPNQAFREALWELWTNGVVQGSLVARSSTSDRSGLGSSWKSQDFATMIDPEDLEEMEIESTQTRTNNTSNASERVPFFRRRYARRFWCCSCLWDNTCRGKQAILMIPFGLAGLSFVLWVLVKFGMSVVAADDDYCWGTLPSEFRPHWVPGRDLLRSGALHDQELWRLPADGFDSLQGITVDDSFSKLFTFHRNGARVFSIGVENGTILGVENVVLYNMSKDFGKIIDYPVWHIGGVDWASSDEFGQEIWLATHAEQVNTEGGLFAVDAKTLRPIASRSAAKAKGDGWDWVAFHPGTHRLYYGTFWNVRSVRWVDIVDLDDDAGVLDITFNDTDPFRTNGLQYIQSATIDAENNWLYLISDDASNTLTQIDLATGRALRHEPLFAGNEADGIGFHAGRNTLLCGYNRQHSHEDDKEILSILEFHLVR